MQAQEKQYWTVPNPVANDNVVRILLLGHSFFVGSDDLQGILPAMLKHQKGWNSQVAYINAAASSTALQVLVDQGHFTQEQLGLGGIDTWLQIKSTVQGGNFDIITILNGTSEANSESANQGTAMLGSRYLARTLTEMTPATTTVIGLAVWGPVSADYQTFAADTRVHQAAWRGSCGAAAEAQIIFDMAQGTKGPAWNFLKSAWDATGHVQRYMEAACGEAFMIAYAEKGISSDFLLHRSLVNRDNHDNLWGGYLESAVYFSMITGERFDGRGYSETVVGPGHANATPEENKTTIPDDIARFLEDAAWRAVVRDRTAMGNLLNGRPAGVDPIVPGATLTELGIHRVHDIHGREVESQTLPGGRRPSSRLRTWYDAQGLVQRRETIAPDGSVSDVRTFTPVYEAGRLAFVRHFNTGGVFIGRDAFTYHPDGKKASEKFEDSNGVADATYTFSYEGGRLSETRFFNAGGGLETITSHFYDGAGRLGSTLETHQQTGATVTRQYVYESGDAQAKISEVRQSSSGFAIPQITRYRYDTRGKRAQELVYRAGLSPGDETLISSTTYFNDYRSE